MEKNDDQALRVALGENWRRFIPPDDVDREDVDAFFAAWNTSHKMVADAESRVHLAVGADEWILPIPIVKIGNGWRFDVKAGAEEIRTRRRLGAFEDQGVRITAEDRSAGVLRGARDAIDVSAYVRTQADGSVRVEFNTAGATSRDPDLINRVTRSDDHGRSKCADEGAQADDPFADQG